MQQAIGFFKHSEHFFLNISNSLSDVTMLSGKITVQQAAVALKVITNYYFKSEQLMCCLIKNNNTLQYQHTLKPKNLVF